MRWITNFERRGIVRVPPIQYIVEGGHRLRGAIEPSGNKNSALPIIAAALLTEHPVTLDNVTAPNAAPTVATTAAATPSPVTGTTTDLSVLGDDDAGESNLTNSLRRVARSNR